MTGPSGSRRFDRMAARSADFVASPAFFAACVLLILLWGPSLPVFGSVDTWQLVINTATTIVTFLLVALLHNDQHRSDQEMHAKLDAILDAIGSPSED